MPGLEKQSRLERIKERKFRKAVYQQAYRDERLGLPDKRRIATTLLDALIEFESRKPNFIYERLFGIVVDRLAPIFDRDALWAQINALRTRAYEKAEDAKFRRRKDRT
ncbi:hypothetical protein [Rhodoblastus sp.]|uniref:hypothetical protein n=1 Tax=Rhodoblastus sp. TaxID=1962975 RepID=UPI003F973361